MYAHIMPFLYVKITFFLAKTTLNTDFFSLPNSSSPVNIVVQNLAKQCYYLPE